MDRLRSRIPFRRPGATEPVAALDHLRIVHASAGLGWQGLHVEVGENHGWAVDDVVVGGHYVALNLDPVPLRIERRAFAGFERVEIAPGALWVQPAGDPFTFRVAQTSRDAGVVLDDERARSLVGAELRLEAGYGLDDPVLAGLVRAVAAEAAVGRNDGGSAARLFVDGMTMAFAVRLAAVHGTKGAAIRGGVAPRRLQDVVEFIDAHLADGLSLDMLAGVAGLSVFHFARAFRQSTGATPHRFVLDRRLDRARDLLATGDRTVTDAAHACGFADQAHLSRDREGDVAWLTEAGYAARLANGQRARKKFDETGEVDYVAGVDETDPNVGMPGKFVWDWYHLWSDRGAWDNRYAVMSDADLLPYESIDAARRVTTPWLMVHSDQCFLPDAARRHFAAAPSPAKQMIWDGSTPHLDYYDRPEVIDATVARISAFLIDQLRDARVARVA